MTKFSGWLMAAAMMMASGNAIAQFLSDPNSDLKPCLLFIYCDGPKLPPGFLIHDAKPVSTSVPSPMVQGQKYLIKVVMRNDGSATWDQASKFYLGSKDIQTWGPSRVAVSGSVGTSSEATFEFMVKAPDKEGLYPVRWQMLQEDALALGVGADGKPALLPFETFWFGKETTTWFKVLSSVIKGSVDGISNNAITGWACSTNLNDPIAVHLYAGGAAGAGTYVGSYKADRPSEEAVATACEASGTAYRYSIPITTAMVTAHGGKSIYVHGISPVGSSNLTLANSGKFKLPANQLPKVSLTSPATGTVVYAPGSFTLKASASDSDDGLLSVAFYNGSTLLNTDTQAPYQYTVSNLGVGRYSFKAVAKDTRGASTTSAIVTAIVEPPQQSPSSLTRKYTYDQYQRLCRVDEPETGSSFMGYDGANNLAWSAAGVSGVAGGCQASTVSAVAARRVDRRYDPRNRLLGLDFPDGNGNQAWTYTADGLPATITTYNGPDNRLPVVNTYTYNKRRLLVGETSGQTGKYTWSLTYGYDANGNLSGFKYPDGLTLDLAPNALGQPSKVGSYASGIRYYPNGAVRQFTYGNGITHAMTQNARQLPTRSTDSNKAMDLAYGYDKLGNVNAITDYVDGRQTRSMGYDKLNRLTTTTSNMFGTARYSYDKLDNLLSLQVTGGSQKRHYGYFYDNKNRLANVTDGVSGATLVGLDYDVQGNLANKNGQAYTFDYGNRLRAATGKEIYYYDGHGRRIESRNSNNQYSVWQYSRDGRLMYSHDLRNNRKTNYIHLGSRLLALREKPMSGTGAETAKYQHTDALGTPIAETATNKAILGRSEYEPYGQLVNRTLTDGPGFTGHVQDAATGLTYMQQRYYDPILGRFLSVDPVTAYSNPVGVFNRYWYASNNPYKFTDPDGRYVESAIDVALIVADVADISSNGLNWNNGLSLAANVVGLAVPVGTGFGPAVRGVSAAADAVKASDNVVKNVAKGSDAAVAEGRASRYANTTTKGAGQVERSTNVSQQSMKANLTDSGYKAIPSNPKVEVMSNGKQSYVFRSDKPTVELKPNADGKGPALIKIRNERFK